MIRAPLEITIEDADGAAHSYVIALHRPADGMRVVQALVALVGPPLLAALKPGDIRGGGGLGGILERLDPQAVGDALGSALMRMEPWLWSELMRHAHRDGKPLGQAQHFDAAFGGNYAELLRAAKAVIDHNGFFSQLATFLGASRRKASEPVEPSTSSG